MAERIPVVLVKGGATSGGPAGRGQPHRLAGHRRPGVRRHVPPGRGDPGRHHRGGLRGGGHLRHPARAAGPPGGGGQHRRRLGRGHRRRHRRHVPRADVAARRPDRRPRRRAAARGGAATTRSTWPAARPRTPSPPCWRSWPATPTWTRVVLLGMGIQSNQARMERDGPFYPDHGLERIVAFHDRQDHRYTATAAALADELGKPVLVATELAVTFPDNAAVRGVVEAGKLCYPSSNRAVGALDHLWERARWRRHHRLLRPTRAHRVAPSPLRSTGWLDGPSPRWCALALVAPCWPPGARGHHDHRHRRARRLGAPARCRAGHAGAVGPPAAHPAGRPRGRRPAAGRAGPDRGPGHPHQLPGGHRPTGARSTTSTATCPLMPASTEKLLTATALLAHLSADTTLQDPRP